MFAFHTPRPRRRPSLTPMIDVVFLLLIFFMLAARFGVSGAVPITLTAGAGQAYDGPPRLLDIAPDGLRLNGVAIQPDQLPGALRELMADPQDLIVLRGIQGVDVQRILDVMTLLRAEGLTNLGLVE